MWRGRWAVPEVLFAGIPTRKGLLRDDGKKGRTVTISSKWLKETTTSNRRK